MLDHILIGCSDLDDGVAFMEKLTGIRAAFGGVHPGGGTRNALLSLGERQYLEIIAPDPAQHGARGHYGLQKLTAPRLVGWAAHPGNLDDFAKRLRAANLAFDGPTPGSRKRPDGKLLQWKTLNLRDDLNGLLPFFIEWSDNSAHPSAAAPRGCHLESLELLTPDPDSLAKIADQLGLAVDISKAAAVQLRAVIRCAAKELQLTS
jgi:Glyoxalase-like domain